MSQDSRRRLLERVSSDLSLAHAAHGLLCLEVHEGASGSVRVVPTGQSADVRPLGASPAGFGKLSHSRTSPGAGPADAAQAGRAQPPVDAGLRAGPDPGQDAWPGRGRRHRLQGRQPGRGAGSHRARQPGERPAVRRGDRPAARRRDLLLDAGAAGKLAAQVRGPAWQVPLPAAPEHACAWPAAAELPGRRYVLTDRHEELGQQAPCVQETPVAEFLPALEQAQPAHILVHAAALGPLPVPIVVMSALWTAQQVQLQRQGQQKGTQGARAPSSGWLARGLSSVTGRARPERSQDSQTRLLRPVQAAGGN